MTAVQMSFGSTFDLGVHWIAGAVTVLDKHRQPTMVELRLDTPATSLTIRAGRDAAVQLMREWAAALEASA